jgi:hypothetical protein
MPLRALLTDRVKEIPGCIGAGYIDLESGLPLAVVSDPPMDEAAQNLLAVGAVQAMSSSTASELGGALVPGAGDEPAFRETVILSEHSIHVFERMTNYPNEAVCLIFRADADPEMVLRAARGSLSKLIVAGIF